MCYQIPLNLCVTRYSRVHLDIVGPPSAAQDSPHQNLTTFKDRMTKLIGVQPISSPTADVKTASFLNSWISKFGVPLSITTDRGSQFESAIFIA